METKEIDTKTNKEMIIILETPKEFCTILLGKKITV